MRLHLHLGCGLVHRPGWVNLDRYVTDSADIQADAVLLPFPAGSAEACGCQARCGLGVALVGTR